jgi:gamma-glutamylputrescine oxidase
MDTLLSRPHSYYRATEKGRPASTPWSGSVTADVVIIGAGLVGLSTALHCQRRGLSVCVIEQGELGFGASGRNGGQVHVGMRRDQWWLEDKLGIEAARRLWELSLAAREHLGWLLNHYQIDCDFQSGLIAVNHKPQFDRESAAYVEHLQRAYQYNSIEYWDRAAMSQQLQAHGYFGGSFDAYGGHLHPLNFVLGLARAALQESARIYTGVRVTQIDSSSAVKTVYTTHGEVRGAQLVLAANGYLGDLEPRVARRVMPINNFIVATEPLGERALELIRSQAAVSDSRFVVNYFRCTRDGRLLFGGGENYSTQFPKDIAAFVRPHLESVFPQLKNVALDYAWGGTLAITPHRLPFIRELNPGYINASGFSGLGVVLGPLVGRVVADALCNDRDVFAMLERLPSQVFPGGAWFRSPALALAMLFYALRDRL